jgi:hypothetical protein
LARLLSGVHPRLLFFIPKSYLLVASGLLFLSVTVGVRISLRRFPHHVAAHVCIPVCDLLPCSASMETISAPRFSSPALGVRRAVFLSPPRLVPRSAFLFPRSSVFGVECLFVFVTVFFSHRPALSPAAGQCVYSAGQSSTTLSFLPASFFLARVCFSSGIYCLALSSSGLLQLWCLDVPVCTRLLLTVELFSVEFGFRFSAMCGMVAGECHFSF